MFYVTSIYLQKKVGCAQTPHPLILKSEATHFFYLFIKSLTLLLGGSRCKCLNSDLHMHFQVTHRSKSLARVLLPEPVA
ncbi:hypothetical protein XELAEV_18033269mg [Xenopus laevis]|uniref:Uncharacterized protein n=1 Tax=Xenopus laevis TaxID=8355 RepID=A0A974CK20_XENLA|nr:hypothetical protein XELAEV_18033269mg [Xenopus laevis]